MTSRTTPQTRTPSRKAAPWADVTAVFTGYMVILFAIPSSMTVPALGSLGAPATILSMLSFVWWTWHHVHRDSAEPAGTATPVRWALCALLMIYMLVYTHAAALLIPPAELTNLDSVTLRLIGFACLGLVLTDGVANTERWRTLTRHLVVAGTLLALLALLQVITHSLLIDRITLPGLSPVSQATITTRAARIRPSATSTNPIEFGAVLAMLIPIALVHARHSKKNAFLAHFPLFSMGLAALLALSRTALIATAVSLIFLLPIWPTRRRIMIIFSAVIGAAMAGVAIPGLIGTVRGMFTGAGNDSSVNSRTASYGVAWDYFMRHPFIGRGNGTFLPQYWILDNGWLQIAIGAGVLGIAAFGVLLGATIWSGLRASKTFRDSFDAELSRALMASTIAGTVSMALFDALSFPQSAGMVIMTIGLSGAALRLARGERKETVALEGRLQFASRPQRS